MSTEVENSLRTIEDACKDCPVIDDKCFFGKSALDSSVFKDPNTRKQAIAYVWAKQDVAKECPKPASIKAAVNQLLKQQG